MYDIVCLNSPVQAYGIVWKAVDKRRHTTVALKKCFDAFRNATDSQRTYREIMYLQVRSFVLRVLCVYAVGGGGGEAAGSRATSGMACARLDVCVLHVLVCVHARPPQELAGHDNIIRLLNIIRAENDRDIYLVFDHMGTYVSACVV